MALLPSSYRRLPKKLQDYPTMPVVADKMTAKSVFTPVINRYTEFNSLRYSNLSVRSSSIQPSSVVVDEPLDDVKTLEVEKKRSKNQTVLRRQSLEHCSALEHSKHVKGLKS